MKNTLMSQLKRQNPDLKEAEIEGILWILSEKTGIRNHELIRETGISKEVLRGFLRSLNNMGFLGDGLDVGPGLELSQSLGGMDLKPYLWTLLEFEDKELEEKIVDIRENYKLKSKREFDQFFATPKTTVSKAMILAKKGLVEGKKIALLGDDDLVSITLGTGFEGQALNITAFDIDGDVLAAIKHVSKGLGIDNVQTVLYDVRQALPGEFLHKFDVVLTDPPYTKAGVKLFLNRAIQLAKNPKDFSGPYIFLCYGTGLKASERVLEIQDVIQQFGLVIEDKIDKFNRYDGAETIGSASSLYILKVTKATKALSEYAAGKIYTFEQLKKTKFPYVAQYTFKVFNVPGKVLRSEKILTEKAEKLCQRHRLKVVDTKVTRFKPKGCAAAVISKNSNLVLHAWPEHNAVHIDLVACARVYDSGKLLSTICGLFETDLVGETRVE